MKRFSREKLLLWLRGGKDPAFFEYHRKEIDAHNSRMLRIIVSAMTLITGAYYLFDLNSGGEANMRRSYLVFFAIFLILYLWIRRRRAADKPLEPDAVLMVTEVIFLFLLLVGPIYDPKNLACYVPVFFIMAYIVPMIPLTRLAAVYGADLLLFWVLTLYCKDSILGLYDVVDSFTCFMMGLVLGRNILAGRLSTLEAYDRLEAQSASRLAVAMDAANKDSLTGVQSRLAYETEAGQINKAIAGLEKPEFALVFCDVNNLKSTNDEQGHESGDRLIRECAALICRIYAHSPVYRVGGDEFAVLLRNSDYRNRVALREEFAEEMERSGISMAWGMACYDPARDADVKAVYARADSDMYRNKQEMKAERQA